MYKTRISRCVDISAIQIELCTRHAIRDARFLSYHQCGYVVMYRSTAYVIPMLWHHYCVTHDAWVCRSFVVDVCGCVSFHCQCNSADVVLVAALHETMIRLSVSKSRDTHGNIMS